MITYLQVRDVLEAALEQHGPNASALAGAVCELVPPEYREVTYSYATTSSAMAITGALPRCSPRCSGLTVP